MIKTVKKPLRIAIIIMIQLCICILVGTQKKGFFCDEIYSYGLANSEAYAFISPESSRQYSNNGWVDSKYFKDYIEVSEKKGLSFTAAFRNQAEDVHPPFYYCLLHFVCYLFRGSFSKWTGLGLNFLILILTDLFLLYIINYFFQDINKAMLGMILWSCSAAGLSNILFIRMYLLQTCEILAFVTVHIRVIKYGKIHFQKRDYLTIALLVTLGGLTHYYYYFFVFFFSGILCIYLLFSKNIANLIKYMASLLIGFALALIIFPYTINHVLNGYRGTEVLSNLSGNGREVFSTYFNWINQASFGGCLKFLPFVFVACISWKLLNKYLITLSLRVDMPAQKLILNIEKKGQWKISRKRTDKFCFNIRLSYLIALWLVSSYTIFGILAMKGSLLVHNRYIYPIYPMISIMLLGFMLFCIRQIIGRKNENKLLLCLVLLVCGLSIYTYHIDFMYRDYGLFRKQAERVRGYDCLLWYGDGWLDTYTGLPLKQIYDETYFLHPNEISNVSEILNLRKTSNPVVVCLPDQFTPDEAEAELSLILKFGGFTGYQKIYQYYTQAYLL